MWGFRGFPQKINFGEISPLKLKVTEFRGFTFLIVVTALHKYFKLTLIKASGSGWGLQKGRAQDKIPHGQLPPLSGPGH